MGGRTDPARRRLLVAGFAVVLIAAMALDTKIVKVGTADLETGIFSADAYGVSEFPKVQATIEKRAIDAPVLAAAIAKDQPAAEKQYGVPADTGAEFAVKFTGKVGKKDEDSGTYPVTVDGVPDSVHITMQAGPAILGTDLRDGTGLIAFGQFRNQIDYQNAGAALNTEMKHMVLSKIDADALTGKTVSVYGVFQLTDPATWQVTPAKIDVQ